MKRNTWLLAIAGALGLTPAAYGQFVQTWQNNGTSWQVPANWSGAVPTALDSANLTPFGINPLSVQNPGLGAPAAAGFLNLGNTPLGGNYTLGGNGNTLALGNSAAGNVPALLMGYQWGTVTLDNTTLNVAAGTAFAGGSIASNNPLALGYGANLTLTNGSTLNTSAANAAVALRSGVLTLNPGTSLNVGTAQLRTNGGGTVVFHGAAAPTAYNVTGQFSVGGSDAIVRLLPSDSNPLNVVFTNTAATGAGITRFGFSAMLDLTTESAVAVGSGGTAPTFIVDNTTAAAGTQNVPVQNGVVMQGATTATRSPYLTISTVGGQGREAFFATATVEPLGANRFAFSRAATVAAGNAAALTGAASSNNVAYNPTGSETATATITAQTVAITPSASGFTANLGGNAFQPVGLILNRAGSFTMTNTTNFMTGHTDGLGTVTNAATRTIIVADPSGTLTLGAPGANVVFAGDGTDYAKSGPGLLVFGGDADQVNGGANALEFHLSGGVTRARISGANANFGTGNLVQFRGGVFEVEGGGTFARNLGVPGGGNGTVNWALSTVSGNSGSGGFSARGGDLTVNLQGGVALGWGSQTGVDAVFIRDGQALKFGSPFANSTVIWQNPINLQSGVAAFADGRYIARVIDVTRGVGSAAEVRMDGVIDDGAQTIDLIKAGTGTLHLNAANTFDGRLIVQGGRVLATADNNLGSTTAGANRLLLNGGGLEASGTFTINAARGVALGAGGGSIFVNGANTVTYAGIITGPGGLTKDNAGTLTLTGANTYAGPTTVAGGTLRLDAGSITSTVTVASGATLATGAGLAGTGTVNGNVTIADGGVLAPGASPGVLVVSNGALTVNGTYNWELGALSTSNPGVNFDLVRVAGGAASGTFGGGELTVSFTGAATNPNGGDPFWSTDRLWTIVQGESGGTINDVFGDITNANWSTGFFDFASGTTGANGSVQLQWNFTGAAVPEPGTLALLSMAGAGAAFGWYRRRKQGRTN